MFWLWLNFISEKNVFDNNSNQIIIINCCINLNLKKKGEGEVCCLLRIYYYENMNHKFIYILLKACVFQLSVFEEDFWEWELLFLVRLRSLVLLTIFTSIRPVQARKVLCTWINLMLNKCFTQGAVHLICKNI